MIFGLGGNDDTPARAPEQAQEQLQDVGELLSNLMLDNGTAAETMMQDDEEVEIELIV